MYQSCFKISDDKVQQFGLRFESKIEEDKLIIKAYDKNNGFKYICEIDEDSMINFNAIIRLLGEGKLTIESKDETHVSIKLGRINIEFKRQNQPEKDIKNDQQERIKYHEQRIKHVEDLINLHLEKIGRQEDTIKKQERLLEGAFKEITELRQEIAEEKKTRQSQFCTNDEKITTEKKNELLNCFEIKLKQVQQINNLQFKNLHKQIIEITEKMMKNDKQLIDQHQEIKQIKSKNHDLTNQIKIETKKIDEMRNIQLAIKQMQLKIKHNQTVIRQQNSVLNKQTEKMIQQLESKNNLLSKQIQKIKQQKELKNQELKKSSQVQKSMEWSQQLKTQHFKIDKNLIKFVGESIDNCEFSLVKCELHQHRQTWGIKIKQFKNYTIRLGICLKNKIQENNFNYQDQKFYQLGHGCYLIGLSGYCFSHSSNEINYKNQHFYPEIGDVIFVEYDPIQWKLRFRKNHNDQMLAFSLIAPPQDDCYYPCVVVKNPCEGLNGYFQFELISAEKLFSYWK